MTWIVITGDPVEGLLFEGPFDTERAAIDYVDQVYSYAEPCAWIGQLHPPGWVPNSIDNTQAQRHGYPPRTELIDPGGDDAGR